MDTQILIVLVILAATVILLTFDFFRLDLVLLAAVCAANSFMLPTHQVNALLMSAPGVSQPGLPPGRCGDDRGFSVDRCADLLPVLYVIH